ncbi:MAG TPA: DUF2254 domain-containing protein [Steroidobacteraceae bacterium]|nr:DUF2254 domain-containing protein [Steroidobacteraceae bacterium]
MNWSQKYGLRNYLKSSLWLVPFIAIPIELVVTRLLHGLDGWLGWTLLGLTVQGALALLGAFVTVTLSFVVFTFGSLLIAIQVASAQMTPRIIAPTLLRNGVVKYTVGLFIFTLMFMLSAQNRMDKEVHQLVVLVAALLGISSFAAFFYLIDYASRLLRPISILAHVGNSGLEVIESVYPELCLAADIRDRDSVEIGAPDRVVQHQGAPGIILAVNLDQLIADAERLNGIIEFVCQIGDFVSVDEPLFNLYGGTKMIDEARLRASIALGSERTLEQDPTFAFRIIVDIALKALSPAINDPTTAVLAIDQLHRMLRDIGKRNLRTDELFDKSGRLRVVFRTPDWEDVVHLAFREIRACGSSHLQIVRRLRAMIENLLQTLPARHHPALLEELGLLDREIEKYFTYPEDRMLAHVADAQGLGGHRGTIKH